jgi:beta-dihydromenaquinone-9 omega-hydroxylase
MNVRHDARLARSVTPSLVRGLWRNISIDTAAKFTREHHAGVRDTTFDPFDPVTAADPYPGYRRLLSGDRVHFNRKRNMFLLCRYDDVRAAARNDALLSSREGVVRSRVELPILLNLDRPRHTELRRKVQPAFAKGRLAGWQATVDRLATELVGDVLANPGCDVVAKLAVPMPMRMIAHVMGVPPEDEAFFRHWSNEAVRVANVENTPRGMSQIPASINGVRQLHSYFLERIEDGRLLGADTLLGRLTADADDGEISADELFYFALLLLLAGNETTTNLLSTLMLTLAQYPDQFDAIRSNPDALVPSAIEEQLRYASPIQAFYRTALQDYRVGEAVVPTGARVALLWGAANRDPREYADPDSFRADRNPTGHVAFGSGIHLCLGAGLARMEGRAVLRELVERVDRIDVTSRPTWTTNSSLRGLEELRIRLTPRRAA